MLRFRLGRIPIEVHFSHLVMAGLFAYFYQPKSEGPTWPNSVLGSPELTAQNPGALALYYALWVGIIFASVLIHELGHAVVSLLYGYKPQVSLVWLGGHTHPNAPGVIPWHRDVLLTLAGPVFGLSLGVACLLASSVIPESAEVLQYMLRVLWWSNAVWAIYNLLPVTPLDGGRIATALLQRIFGTVGYLLAQVLALVVSVGVVVFVVRSSGDVSNNLLVLLFMGGYAWRAFAQIRAYLRGEAPGRGPSHPAELALAQAIDLLERSKLQEAKGVAAAALEADPALGVRSRLQHLLGWVALKQGDGRTALNHFSEVQGHKVEEQALAAAFSLVGDEDRAIPLWELAYRQSNDRTILHEWAGALIRTNRVAEAQKLPGVDLILAYGCAERVLFLRGDFPAAARMGEASLALQPRAEVAYDTACAHARAGHPDKAVRMLVEANRLGFTDAGFAASDSDLASLRGHPEFDAWLQRLRKSARA